MLFRSIWDYEVRAGKVEQKFSNKANENPSIGSFTNALKDLGKDAIEDIKNTLAKYEVNGTNLFIVNDDSLRQYKRTILENVLTDIVSVTFANIGKLTTYYLEKERAIELFSDAKNIIKPRKLGSNELRISDNVIMENGKSFNIISPKVTPEEYEKFMTMSQESEQISKIFGPYGGKIRPDILDWIKQNKEDFKALVNTLL